MKKTLFLILFSLLCIQCEESTLLDNTGVLRLETQNLPQLTSGYEYRIWLTGLEVEVLAGRFTISADGTQSTDYFGNINTEDLQDATGIIITISKSNNLGISKPYVMSGTFIGNNISLSITDTSITYNAQAKFQIKTPSDAYNNNETHGIWYANNAAESLLQFPVSSSEAYHFRSWLEIQDDGIRKLLDMGKFYVFNQADRSQRYSSNFNAISYPGEDFFENPDGLNATFPLNLENATIILEVVPGTVDSNTLTSPLGFIIARKTIESSVIETNNIVTMEIPVFSAIGSR